ncbi:MAG: hypothetical protein GXP31_13410 [Kiritimatiellaeota bacterium]|nr:hypothetical protein [Kiritimatiellota bacterium]
MAARLMPRLYPGPSHPTQPEIPGRRDSGESIPHRTARTPARVRFGHSGGRRLHCLLIAGVLLVSPRVPAAESRAQELPPGEFLKLARTPFSTNAWVRASGYVQYRRKDSKGKLPLALAIRYEPNGMRAQIVLDSQWVTTLTETHGNDAIPTVRIAEPPSKQAVRLATLGIRSGDITFSFLYWNLVREFPKDSMRGQACRVLLLANPRNQGRVRAWFHAKYAFPLKALWFRPDADTPWRTLEFKHFKKFGKFWFVKELVLNGEDWRTRVVFRKVDMASIAERPAPRDLFRPTPTPASGSPVPAAQ